MLLALCLADFADDDGRRIFPSVATLGRKTRQSRRSVQNQLRRMEVIGYLSQVGKTPSGCIEYRINLDFFEGGAEFAPPSKGRNSELKGAHSATHKGAKFAPKPPLQPSPNPPQPCSGGCGEPLVYPKLSAPERAALDDLLAGCTADLRQPILDELAGAQRQNRLRVGVVPFCRALVLAAADGRFSSSLGVAVAAARARQATEKAAAASAPFVPDAEAQAVGERLVEKIRARCAREKTV